MLDESTKDIAADILYNIENQSAVILYIDKEGNVILISHDDMSQVQKSIISRIMISIGKSSLIFKAFMFFELFLTNIDFSLKRMFRKNK